MPLIYLASNQSSHVAGNFPNLIDSEWQWGGSDEQIIHSIAAGRVAAMPGWEALGKENIRQVAAYVLHLAGEEVASAADTEAGKLVYDVNCAACHGAACEGNTALGAPGFVDKQEWLYLLPGQNKQESGQEIILLGCNGIMPAQHNRLQPAQIRVLAAWLSGGMKIAPPQ